jgi:hypothetical protein
MKGHPEMNQRLTATLTMLTLCIPAMGSCKRAPVTAPINKNQPLPGVALLDGSGEKVTAVGECGPNFANMEVVPAALLNLDRAGVLKGVESKPELKLALLSALAAVPRSLLQLFFLNLRGEILVTDANKICKDTSLTQEERELLGGPADINACWVAEGKEPLRLVLAENQHLIRSVLVRLFAYMYSEYFIARIQDTNAPAKFQESSWRELTTAFVENNQLLTDAFVTDSKNFGHQKIVALEKLRSVNPRKFANMVFANAVDSYYCSAESNQTFASRFKLTYGVFTEASRPLTPVNVFGPSLW